MITIPSAILAEHLRSTIENLLLTPAELEDKHVRDFIVLTLRTSAEEKTSSPDDWTPAQRAAYDAGNWRLFSELRGYTETEIATFARFLDACKAVEVAHGDPTDPYNHTAAMSHELHQCIDALGENLVTDQPWESIEKQVYAAAADNIGAAFDLVAQGK